MRGTIRDDRSRLRRTTWEKARGTLGEEEGQLGKEQKVGSVNLCITDQKERDRKEWMKWGGTAEPVVLFLYDLKALALAFTREWTKRMGEKGAERRVGKAGGSEGRGEKGGEKLLIGFLKMFWLIR
jgi:hypothetical protein